MHSLYSYEIRITSLWSVNHFTKIIYHYHPHREVNYKLLTTTNEKLLSLSLFCLLVMKIFLKNFMNPLYGWGSTVSRLQSHSDGLLFTTKSSGISGAHLTDFGRMKGWVDLRAIQWFWSLDSWIGNLVP